MSTTTQFEKLFDQYTSAEVKLSVFIDELRKDDVKFIKTYQSLLGSNSCALDYIDRHFTATEILRKFIIVYNQTMFTVKDGEFVQSVLDRHQVQLDDVFVEEHFRILFTTIITGKYTGSVSQLFEFEIAVDQLDDCLLEVFIDVKSDLFKESFKSGIPSGLLHKICEKGKLKPYMYDILDRDHDFVDKAINGDHDAVMKSLIDCQFYDLLNRVAAVVSMNSEK